MLTQKQKLKYIIYGILWIDAKHYEITVEQNDFRIGEDDK